VGRITVWHLVYTLYFRNGKCSLYYSGVLRDATASKFVTNLPSRSQSYILLLDFAFHNRALTTQPGSKVNPRHIKALVWRARKTATPLLEWGPRKVYELGEHGGSPDVSFSANHRRRPSLRRASLHCLSNRCKSPGADCTSPN
jgi:hypothetical protein